MRRMEPGLSSYRWSFPSTSWQFLVLPSVLIYGTHSILLNLCKSENGEIPFNSAAVVLLIELTKLFFSLAMWIPELLASGNNPQSVRLSVKSSWIFAAPALLYGLNNNLVVYVQHYVDPASFQILSNLKIASTAILYRVMVKRRLSRQQWVALGLLVMSGISNSYGGIQSNPESASGYRIHVTLPGMLLMFVYCTISGLSGVYTEYILKKHRQASLHQQNVLLYTYGIILNFGGYLLIASSASHGAKGFFHGFTRWTFIIILTQAINGMIMSVIMKHASNIVRLFIISCAMLVTTVVSVMVFSLQLNVYFCLAFSSVIIALWLYHKR